VGKYCRVGQTTDDNVAHVNCGKLRLHTLIVCNTGFHGTSGCKNANHCYVIRTLPVLLKVNLIINLVKM
jgi:hypothetical protein